MSPTDFPHDLIPEDWQGQIILGGVRGSRAYNTALPDDDYDYWAIWKHEPSYYYSLRRVPEGARHRRQEVAHVMEGQRDLLLVEVGKFIQYLSRSNPQYHNWLWVGPQNTRIMTHSGRAIFDNRSRMLGSRVLNAYRYSAVGLVNEKLYHRALLRLSQLLNLASVREPAVTPYHSKLILEHKQGKDLFPHKGLTPQQVCARIMNGGVPEWGWDEAYFNCWARWNELCVQVMETEDE